ncbi:MAG: response regulator transcription factor, partial [Acidobacteriota bacterium]|nr:response regulator transcription factor [Acidobacteriota bacterium]
KNIKVVGEAADLSEALDLIPKIRPDILLVDSSEADKNTFTSFVSSQPSYTSIIILTNSSETEIHRRYLMLGVNGVVTKEQTADILFNAINKVHDGEMWFVRKLMEETIKQLITEKKSMPEEIYSYNCSGLSTREREVLVLICQGMKNKIIADKLFISETTVRHHLTSIFEKLSVTSRLELVVHAFKEKLVEVPVESFELLNDFK